VIAIIGVLVGLLLPAVQAAREAARRSSCSNNLKQWGLGLQNHLDVKKRFPPGSTYANPWGASWMVHMLPYVEQTSKFDQMDLSQPCWHNSASVNMLALNGFNFATLHCPSSPLPQTGAGISNLGHASANACYVGIAGSADEAAATTYSSGHGIVGSKGVLFPNARVGVHDITDGTSKQLVISEHGDYQTDANDVRQHWRGSQPHSFAMGFNRTTPPSGGGDPGDLRAFNTTTIRYAINARRTANQPGVSGNFGNNIPLNSAHSGGVNSVFADGSVRFLADAIQLTTLQALAKRDDGVVVNPE